MIPVLVAAIAACTGLGVALIGRERWPADLRDAKRLGEIIDKMDPGSSEREIAAEYRDDLATRWIIGRVGRKDVLRDLAIALMGSSCVVIAAGVVSGVLTLIADEVATRAEAQIAMVAYLMVGFTVFAGAISIAHAYRKRQDRYLSQLRIERGMRSPVAEWVQDFDKRYKQRPPLASEAPGTATSNIDGASATD